jgi:acyl-CoA thioester hydrolase
MYQYCSNFRNHGRFTQHLDNLVESEIGYKCRIYKVLLFFYKIINMSKDTNQPQLPPTSAIESVTNVAFENWFEYPVRAQPHHTDYAGIVWHGTYLTWMEEARVECLRSIGIDFADLVALGCDLPVVELSIRYHRSVQLGMSVLVRTRMAEVTGVRMNWDYKIISPDHQDLYITAQVTLVALDREKGKIMRQLPPAVQDALAKISGFGKIG